MAVHHRNTVVHTPSREFVESTNVKSFMKRYEIADHSELIARTSSSIDGVDESGIDWFWDVVIDELGIEFYELYDVVRDDTDGPEFTRWYPGGKINIASNVVDRHGKTDAPSRNRVACIWESESGQVRTVTFSELNREANQVANALVERGIGVGDTVALYLPMIPEAIAILYGCFKVGAIAIPIFSGFAADAVSTRIDDANTRVLVTADGFYRRGTKVHLKKSADEAVAATDSIEHVLVFERFGDVVRPWNDGRDETWDDAVLTQRSTFDTRVLDASAESMVLYSSGTTGRPKGIVHTHAGVLVQCAKEIFFGFDHKPHDRFFWVSDIGWMMGPWMLIGNHTFGGTVFMFEGAPDYPSPDRFWEMIDYHGITVFGISPTAIRSLKKHGDAWVDDHDLSSLRLLGSTGEPWDSESWMWFYERVGGSACPIINISGGTEICGCFLMPMPIQSLKPCTLGGPGLGMKIDIVDENGTSIIDTHERGHLVARDSCPSMTKSLWDGDQRYLDEYWSTWPGLWNHGDWAQRDEDGFWFLHGRSDDVLNVAGRKVGPAEIEDALIEHAAINQAAVIGVPDETTGTGIVVYVTLEPAIEPSEELRSALRDHVASTLGKPFRPREVLFVDAFPMTQSGKVIRRAMQAVYTGESVGDLSGLKNPEVLSIIEHTR